KPAAKRQPYKLQYTPNVASMLSSVLIFVRPSKSSFPLVRPITRMALNFQANTPRGARRAAILPQRLRFAEGSGGGANCAQRAQLKSAASSAPQFGQTIGAADSTT